MVRLGGAGNTGGGDGCGEGEVTKQASQHRGPGAQSHETAGTWTGNVAWGTSPMRESKAFIRNFPQSREPHVLSLLGAIPQVQIAGHC